MKSEIDVRNGEGVVGIGAIPFAKSRKFSLYQPTFPNQGDYRATRPIINGKTDAQYN